MFTIGTVLRNGCLEASRRRRAQQEQASKRTWLPGALRFTADSLKSGDGPAPLHFLEDRDSRGTNVPTLRG